MTGGVSRGGFSEFSKETGRAREATAIEEYLNPLDGDYFSRLASALGADQCENTPLRWAPMGVSR